MNKKTPGNVTRHTGAVILSVSEGRKRPCSTKNVGQVELQHVEMEYIPRLFGWWFVFRKKGFQDFHAQQSEKNTRSSEQEICLWKGLVDGLS